MSVVAMEIAVAAAKLFFFLSYPFVKSMFDDKSAFMKYDERAASNFHDDKLKKWLLP